MLTDAITWIQSIQLFVEKEELYRLFTNQDHLTDNTFIHKSKFDFLPKLLLVFLLCDTRALHIPGKQKVGRENAAKDYIQILVIILLYIHLSPKYMETEYSLCNTN